MRTKAVKIEDLKELIEKHRIGETGYVKLDPFMSDVWKKDCRSYGSKRINNLDIIVKDAEQSINNSNRYCESISGLAELFGVVPGTLYNWNGWGVIKIKRKRQPLRKHDGKRMYDAKDILSQLKGLLRKQIKD